MVDMNSPYPAPPKKSNTKVIIIVVLAVIVALIGGFLFFRQSSSTKNQEAVVTETQTPSPTPTEAPKVDKATVKIQVQNGTGTPGQAASAVDALTKAGYSADNIKTGNASSYDAKVTTISAKTGFEQTANDMRDALKSTFSNVKIDSSSLDSGSDFDIVIVTGGTKFVEPTPTEGKTTITPTVTTTVTPSPTSLTPSPVPTH